MQPQLRGMFDFMPTLEGVCFKGLVTPCEVKRTTIRGSYFYPLMEKLYPRLDGRHAWEAVLAELTATEQVQAGQLLTFLTEQHLVRDATDDPPDGLSEAERARFAGQIAYINCYTSAATWHFELFRQARVLLVGAGRVVVSLARNLWENGLNALDYQPTDPAASSQTDLVNLQHSLTRTGLPVHFNAQSTAQPEAYDLVIYAADCFEARSLEQWAERCRAAGIAFYPAFLTPTQGCIGLLQLPGLPGCWQCSRPDPTGQSAQPVGPFAASLLGNTLAYRAFRYFTSFVGPENRSFYRLDLASLDQSQHLLDPTRLCPTCANLTQI